jgi:sulfur relay (sulfurtransferase) DsrF/TusC family protein
MAPKKVTESTNQTNATNSENQVQSPTVDVEKEKLVNEVNELKAMVQALLAQQNQPKSEPETSSISKSLYESVEDRLDIDPKQYIRIVSLTNGGLNLKTLNTTLRIEDFGGSVSVTFEDLRAIVNNHSKAAKEGMFLIQNEKAVMALYLEKDYEKMLNRDVIDNITTLPEREIKKIFETTTNTIKQTIVERVIEGVVAGDSKYQDRNKIKLIGDLIGKNIYDYVKEIEDIS